MWANTNTTRPTAAGKVRQSGSNFYVKIFHKILKQAAFQSKKNFEMFKNFFNHLRGKVKPGKKKVKHDPDLRNLLVDDSSKS